MSDAAITRPDPSAVLELFKPVTWFPPVWAFLCGVVASGAPMSGKWGFAALGLLLAGPMVCATSQAVNDWFDRHVDAINEPHRPIPSGRIPGRLGLYIAIFWSFASLLVGATLAAAQAERLVGQPGLRAQLRVAALDHGSGGDLGRRPCLARHRHGFALWPRGAWHHDAERLQIH